jgi:hypothetical protein
MAKVSPREILTVKLKAAIFLSNTTPEGVGLLKGKLTDLLGKV